MIHHVSEPSDLDNAIEEMTKEGAGAIFILPDLMLAGQTERIAEGLVASPAYYGLGTVVQQSWVSDGVFRRVSEHDQEPR